MRATFLAVMGLAACEAKTPSSTPQPSAAQAPIDEGTPEAPPIDRLRVEHFRGFRGDAHAIVALADGDLVAALSYFVETDVGTGPLSTTKPGRQGLVVRIRADGTTAWAQPIDLWTDQIAWDGGERILLVGQSHPSPNNAIIVSALDGRTLQAAAAPGYAHAAAFARDGRALVGLDSLDAGPRVVAIAEPEPTLVLAVETGDIADLAVTPDGGLVLAIPDGDATRVVRFDRDGKSTAEMRFRGNGAGRLPIALHRDGDIVAAHEEESAVVRFRDDGQERWRWRIERSRLLPEAIAVHGAYTFVGGQLGGKLTLGTTVLDTLDEATPDGGRRGHGDPVVLVLDGTGKVVALAHATATEPASVLDLAIDRRGRLWAVGTMSRTLDFGDAGKAASWTSEYGSGFVVALAR